MIQTDPGSIVNAFGGLLLVVLGIVVLSVSPRRTVNRAFAAFSGGFGIWAVAWNLPQRVDPVFSWFILASAVGFLCAGVGLIALALVFPRPIERSEGRRVLVAGLLAAPLFVVWTVLSIVRNEARQAAFGFPQSAYGAALWGEITGGIFMFGVLFTLIVFALRYGEATPQARIQYALVSAALVIWPAAVNGSFMFFEDGVSHIRSPVFILSLIVVASLWLVNMRVPPATHARGVAWTLLAAPLVGLALAAGLGDFSAAASSGFFGLARTVTVAVFAYAILRHQLLGIDVKIKWTIERSTVAAIFLAVIFLASEGVQVVLGEEQAWLGLLVGATLVFGLAPLQQFAERVSDRAMPDVENTEAYRGRRAREMYLAAVESAAVDGTVTEKERDVMATLADELSLSPAEARALERDALGTDQR